MSRVACGRSRLLGSVGGKIVGGVAADWGQLPFIAALEAPLGTQLCGAAIVSEHWLVTAAHCIGRYALCSLYRTCPLACTHQYAQTLRSFEI